MKDLKDFINESLKDIHEASDNSTEIRDLVVKYSCPKDLYIQVPEKYGESDIQIYLDDTLLPKLPAETQQNALGKNYDNITDCYFEYESIEPAAGVGQHSDIEWDESYDASSNDSNMLVQHIKGMKYVIKFERFTVENATDEEVQDIIYKLFNGFTTDADEELPFDITLNKDKGIEYKKA